MTPPLEPVTLPIDDWTDQIAEAMMKPLRQVGLLLAHEIEELQQRHEDLEVCVKALERRIDKLADRSA